LAKRSAGSVSLSLVASSLADKLARPKTSKKPAANAATVAGRTLILLSAKMILEKKKPLLLSRRRGDKSQSLPGRGAVQ
jgi:hypothetical protein